MTQSGKLKIILNNRTLQYLLFWLVSFLFLLNFFTKGYGISFIDVVYTLLFHISLIFAVSVNSFVLIPGYLAKGKYWKFGILLFALIFVAIWLNIFTFRYLSDWIFPGYYFISYYEWWQLLEFMIIYVGITSLLEFSKSWFREMQLQQELAELEQEKIQTELKALRSQINPHFLFNSLNHIYALAVNQSGQTAKAVLQLSDLLRYAIKHMNKNKVPLKKEIEYLSEYVEWYKSRTDHSDRIYFTRPKDSNDLMITPLLLVVFIENCFKHGRISKPSDKIIITLNLNGSELHLTTENKIESNRELPVENNGLGLENVRRRLNLLYENKHSLDIRQSDNMYRVSLTVELE